MKFLVAGLVLGALGSGLGAGFVLGRAGAPAAVAVPGATPLRVQANDPRELVPLGPGPGDGPGQQPGQPQPGQGQPQQGQGQCTVLMMQDGQLYQLQPGQRGPGDGRGDPAGGDELIPLQPYNGPSPIPGLPALPVPEIKA